MDRRHFLAVAGSTLLPSAALGGARPDAALIASISKETLWTNRDGQGKTWFHPRACMIPTPGGTPALLMNLQVIDGSDYFGPVHWSMSYDLGRSWTDPRPIAALGRDPIAGRDDGLLAAVCDVTPQYHPPTDSVLALGHVVFYKGDYFARDEQLPRYPVYVTRASDGAWSKRKILRWDDPRGAYIYSNNCGQRELLPDGSVQMSFTFGPKAEHRMVAGVHATFDGEQLQIREVGPPLHNRVRRGLLEPSVTSYQSQFWMTIRAEDERGYVSVSDDGLHWQEKRAWAWDDGTPLVMSTTQTTLADAQRRTLSGLHAPRQLESERHPLAIAAVGGSGRCATPLLDQVDRASLAAVSRRRREFPGRCRADGKLRRHQRQCRRVDRYRG